MLGAVPHYFQRHPRVPLILAVSPLCASNTVRRWLAESECPSEPDYKAGARFLVRREDVASHADHRKILIVRDPVQRLVSFYGHWVVRNEEAWCFADDARSVSLVGRTFRQLVEALEALHAQGLERQHHLVPQGRGMDGIEFDRVIRTEALDELFAEIDREHGVALPPQRAHALPYRAAGAFAADRTPAWLREHGLPEWRHFYDDALLGRARALYREDVALYASAEGPRAAG